MAYVSVMYACIHHMLMSLKKYNRVTVKRKIKKMAAFSKIKKRKMAAQTVRTGCMVNSGFLSFILTSTVEVGYTIFSG